MSKQTLVIVAIAFYILFTAFFIEPNSIEVTKYKIESNALAGVRVVFFSDLHLKKHDYKKLNKMIKLISEQKPDIVISGGDYIAGNNLKEAINLTTVAQRISLINAPVYSVLGDSDWNAGGREIAAILQKNGIRVLENSSIRRAVKGKYIDIVGFADLDKREVKTAKAVRGTSKPRILVTHNPDVYFNVMDDFDVILAGHTHGGQIVIPFTPPIYTVSKYKFTKGLLKPGQNKMIVTKGIGTTGIPARFNCKPEIVVVDFIKKN